MLFLTVRDLQFRWARTLVVVILVGLVLTLLFLMTGLVHQLQREPHDTVDRIGAEHWIVSRGVSGPFTAVSTLRAGVALEFASEGATEVVVARGTLEESRAMSRVES